MFLNHLLIQDWLFPSDPLHFYDKYTLCHAKQLAELLL